MTRKMLLLTQLTFISCTCTMYFIKMFYLFNVFVGCYWLTVMSIHGYSGTHFNFLNDNELKFYENFDLS